jgi:hypothetical protein
MKFAEKNQLSSGASGAVVTGVVIMGKCKE